MTLHAHGHDSVTCVPTISAWDLGVARSTSMGSARASEQRDGQRIRVPRYFYAHAPTSTLTATPGDPVAKKEQIYETKVLTDVTSTCKPVGDTMCFWL